MNMQILRACLTAALLSSAAFAQQSGHMSGTQITEAPINTVCPIGKEPIMASAGTVQYKEHTIGLCCPGCAKPFEAWNEARKDAFVEAAQRPEQVAPKRERHTLAATAEVGGKGHIYSLESCPVSGQKLGSMGRPVVREYDGREVRFCCAGCIEAFENDRQAHWKKIDEQIVKQQLMHYPIDTCIVAGGKLGSMGEPVNYVHKNRLIRFCCVGCIKGFEAEPDKHLEALDAKIKDSQLADYPLATCPAMAVGLNAMGGVVDITYMNRLVRLCCEPCVALFENDPHKYMSMIDKAYADKQRESYPIDTCIVAGGKLGSMGDPYEIIAGNRLVRFCCAGCLPRFEANAQEYLSRIRDAADG